MLIRTESRPSSFDEHAGVTTAVLDPGALTRLAEIDPNGTNRLLERVFQAYQASVARLLPQFDDGLRRDDAKLVNLVVHTLKSSSETIGALKLSRLCADMEAMIRAGNHVNMAPSAVALRAEIELVLQAISEAMGGGRLDGKP